MRCNRFVMLRVPTADMAVGRQRDVERARLTTGDTIYIDGGYDIMD
jgi:hypothetical protein